METIKNVIIINLNKHGDPIYAGMKTSEVITGSVTLINQMREREGHFYYAKKGTKGDERRKELAENLYKLGLR